MSLTPTFPLHRVVTIFDVVCRIQYPEKETGTRIWLARPSGDEIRARAQNECEKELRAIPEATALFGHIRPQNVTGRSDPLCCWCVCMLFVGLPYLFWGCLQNVIFRAFFFKQLIHHSIHRLVTMPDIDTRFQFRRTGKRRKAPLDQKSPLARWCWRLLNTRPSQPPISVATNESWKNTFRFSHLRSININ